MTDAAYLESYFKQTQPVEAEDRAAMLLAAMTVGEPKMTVQEAESWLPTVTRMFQAAILRPEGTYDPPLEFDHDPSFGMAADV